MQKQKEEKELLALTAEQISLIRDVFADELADHIKFMFNPKVTGNEAFNFDNEADFAQELLEVVDATLEHDGAMTYGTWQRLAVADGQDWTQYELPEDFEDLSECEIRSLIADRYYTDLAPSQRGQDKLIRAGFILLRTRGKEIWHRDNVDLTWRRFRGPYPSEAAMHRELRVLLSEPNIVEV